MMMPFVDQVTQRKFEVAVSSAPKKIAKIQFGTLKTEEIQKIAELHVSSRVLFQMPLRNAAVNGCMDARLGISDKISNCQTCKKRLTDCAGHFGYIQLELPVFHAGYFKHTLTILQCICKRCSRVLVPPAHRNGMLKKMMNPRIDALMRGALFKRVVELCKRSTQCHQCGYSNGVVKKVGSAFLKIVHEKYRAKHAEDQEEQHERRMEEILKMHPEMKAYTAREMELLTPIRAFDLMSNITDEDNILLWMNGTYGTPDSLIMWSVPVPPVPIRPSVPMDLGGGSTEDDITVKLQEIIEMNNALKMALDQGATMKMIAEDWEFLQIQVALFINGESPGIPRQLMGAKAVRGLCQRLKGKQGRFRGNLSGKRVDFSARTVISPDPNLRVDQVGVPVLVAKIMTFPERVNRYNIERMRKCVQNGPDVHPGANMVRSGTLALALSFADKERVSSNLKYGDVVERHMNDGDVVLFNRQPSLHKMSIMAHHAKVMPWRTFRFNECACTPYNADFDGDEMNMHLPQTEEAKAEAEELMCITNNLVTPRNGEPLVAATQDFLTGAYLLTQKDVFFKKSDFCRIIAYFCDAAEHVDIPPPTIWKPRLLWTGKQVISVLVRSNKKSVSFVNLESEEKFYTSDKHFCTQDGFVAFRRGELISGNLGKKTLGGDTKSSLFYILIRDYGALEATKSMTRLSKLCARFLGDRGFSIGVDDVTPSDRMTKIKNKLVIEGQRLAKEEINAYTSGKIRLKPGCDALQSLESEVNGLLGKVRENCGKEALGALNHRNAPLCMAQCGSKGSPLNISQMIACLGQQSVGGSRIQDGFVGRTLPHFPVGALYPAAKGFVVNSFHSGLTATEFFFHTMGGREGLVDTAVKTAETGYMARRLMKALEDLSMQYDTTVRNSEQSVVQFSYGDDGLNPNVMEKGDRPVDFARLTVNTCLKHIVSQKRRTMKEIDGEMHWVVEDEDQDPGATSFLDEESLSSEQIRILIDKEIATERFTKLLPQGQQFLTETAQFFHTRADNLELLEKIETNQTVGGKEDTEELSEHVKEEGGEEEEGLEDEREGEEGEEGGGGERKLTRLVRNKNANIAEEAEDMEVEQPVTTSITPPVCTLSARQLRLQLAEMTEEERREWRVLALRPGTIPYAESHRLLRDNAMRLTRSQILIILAKALKTFHSSMIEPGEAVGAVGAQSLSEPGTQMTLKTFHFAGVASMNVTLGVPRLKEIINAAKVISTPIIEARLVQSDSMTSARIVKAQIEKTTLGEIAEYIREVHSTDKSYIVIKLDTQAIQNLHLSVDAHTLRASILYNTYGGTRPAVIRMLKERHVLVVNAKGNRLHILPPESKETNKGVPAHQKIYFVIQALKAALSSVIVQGIPTVSRAVINEEVGEKGKKTFYLLVEGYGIQDVMGKPGVDGKNTKTNHIVEMQHVLGIEAARSMISSEINFIMKAYGIGVDRRHLMLLSDVMTFKGEVLGITRFGVAKMRESVLMLASFEKTTDHLFDAAVHSREDNIIGVSECIIMGVPIPIGTGIFKLVHKTKGAPVSCAKKMRLLEMI